MRFTETTLITYQSTRRYIPNDLYLHQRLCVDIRSLSTDCLHIPLLLCAFRTASLYVRRLICTVNLSRKNECQKRTYCLFPCCHDLGEKQIEIKGHNSHAPNTRQAFCLATTHLGSRHFKSVISVPHRLISSRLVLHSMYAPKLRGERGSQLRFVRMRYISLRVTAQLR